MSTEYLKPLSDNMHRLNGRDREFAQSLFDQLHRRNGRGLSDKQWHWVRKLAERATGTEQKPEPVEIGSLARIAALFAKAKQHLKRPAIVLYADGIGELKLAEAGERARVPGSVNVSTNAAYGEATWFGRITMDGAFQPSPRVTQPEGLTEVLKAFAADPAKVAAEHGKLTGSCCFCGRKLTDDRSTAVGYGKKCAQNYGLPWDDSHSASDLFAVAA